MLLPPTEVKSIGFTCWGALLLFEFVLFEFVVFEFVVSGIGISIAQSQFNASRVHSRLREFATKLRRKNLLNQSRWIVYFLLSVEPPLRSRRPQAVVPCGKR